MQLEEIEQPVPKDNEILVRVRATTATSGDCEVRRFKIQPLFWVPLRLYLGITKPRHLVPGQELAGEIEATGKDVRGFVPGDQIFATTGISFGAYADYKCLAADKAVAIKPPSITYEEAAAIPVGGLNALHFLRLAEISTGQKVLIIGASGSIGTVAVQLAKHYGAEVTGVCSTSNLDMVRSLGADQVIDYTKENLAESGATYDVILDVAGVTPYTDKLNLLKPGGRLLLANPKVSEMVRAIWTSRRTDKTVITSFAGAPPEDLIFLRELIEGGELKAVIDRTYPLEQAVEAHRYVEQGHKMGNVVLSVGD